MSSQALILLSEVLRCISAALGVCLFEWGTIGHHAFWWSGQYFLGDSVRSESWRMMWTCGCVISLESTLARSGRAATQHSLMTLCTWYTESTPARSVRAADYMFLKNQFLNICWMFLNFSWFRCFEKVLRWTWTVKRLGARLPRKGSRWRPYRERSTCIERSVNMSPLFSDCFLEKNSILCKLHSLKLDSFSVYQCVEKTSILNITSEN